VDPILLHNLQEVERITFGYLDAPSDENSGRSSINSTAGGDEDEVLHGEII
jgi:hypothetical protein